MTVMTNKQAVLLALFPGVAEALASRANGSGNMPWLGHAQKVYYARNALYIGAALASISMIGLMVTALYAFKMAAIIGVGFTVGAASVLFMATMNVRNQWSDWCNQNGNLFRT